MTYHLLRNLLFRFEPERAHAISLAALRAGAGLGINRLIAGHVPDMEQKVMGLRFPNPVGLAAGLDKNGDAIAAMSALGFGFIEVGTVTPRPQSGNPKPRLFRLPEDKALINRLGFNNKGVDYLVSRIRAARYRGVLGVNIGKNRDTPVENALDDYVACMTRVYPHADYITVNVSSPNTPGLRELQHGSLLDELLAGIKAEQLRLNVAWGRYVPVVVKIAPDMSDEQLLTTADALVRHGMDAVAATNTTLARPGRTAQREHGDETGGLSGRPLMDRSTEVVRLLSDHLQGRLPIIAIGGVASGADAARKFTAGASLVQLYTGLIYQGPGVVGEIVRRLQAAEATHTPMVGSSL
ncbi:quinone-dependent dihydroorotate dehydrogenase [Aquisalimonas sp. 2447]|uniref:quinone-dependent dihydroorotate dehydrogenase n=1 Tax=Aquisalimonas sp. 2447 TaxID=2740807 RepID=UPI00143254E4|nr:quinone-dependent dihydroorotate dehydrogenase [Aquisalimonas sp. 2447]QIT55545.1 quinone-dependent dihydroorotate dehydrogenase [Aquisalimonas sp. 2447]